MPDLIPFVTRQIGTDTIPTVNARDLYEYLEISTDYPLWIKRVLTRAHAVENIDFVVCFKNEGNPKGGRPTHEYHLSFDTAKHIGMMSSATKGHEIRTYFIQKEKELDAITRGTAIPQVKNPSNQLLIEAIIRIDTLEQAQEAQREALLAQQAELIATQQKVIEGFLLAEQANTKADVALEDAHRMTIEEYIVKNGLVRQCPPSECRRMALWLKHFCEQWGIEVHKVPVIAKDWDTENAYPLEAFAAFFRYNRTRPKQITLVKEKDDGHD